MLLQNARPDTQQTDAEDGYLLLTVLVMIFLILLALSVAAPKVAKEIQRDKEREALERGLQYRRAIQLYYKKFGAYPTDIKQLEKTQEIRFLRKRYTDPITGKDDWRLIHMGQAKVPPLGFFGQPLQAGISSVSTGPGLSSGIYAPTNTDGSGDANGSSTGSANGTPNGSPSGSANGSANGTGAPASGGSSSFGFSNSGSSNGSTGGLGSSGSGIGSSNGGFGFPNSGSGSSSSGGVGGTPTGTNGPGGNNSGSTFGSAVPIVGVGIPVKKDSMLEYHKQKKYSDWEFVYDPQTDMMMAGGITNGGNVNGSGSSNNPTGTNNTGGTNGPGGSNGSGGFGFGNGNSGGSSGSGFGNFGNSGSGSGSGSSGTPAPTMPNSPQQ
jgi:type II secretory pathway pseudopilin PulG